MKDIVNLKKKLLAALFALIFALLLSSCSHSPGDDTVNGGDDSGDDAILFTVTFNTHGGSAVSSMTIREGQTVPRPASPSRVGHAFQDWYADSALTTLFDFSTRIYSNATIHARWTAVVTARIRFNTHGGAEMDDVHVPAGGQLPAGLYPPARLGHTFRGWYTTELYTNPVNLTAPVTQNRTLHARWEHTHHIVRFNAQGGTPTPPMQLVRIATPAELAAAPVNVTRAGHFFEHHWYTTPAIGGARVYFDTRPITEDITFYARWQVRNYTVRFNANGGSWQAAGSWPARGSWAGGSWAAGATTTDSRVDHGLYAVLPVPPTRANFWFDGWFDTSAATGGNRIQVREQITANRNFFARWVAD